MQAITRLAHGEYTFDLLMLNAARTTAVVYRHPLLEGKNGDYFLASCHAELPVNFYVLLFPYRLRGYFAYNFGEGDSLTEVVDYLTTFEKDARLLDISNEELAVLAKLAAGAIISIDEMIVLGH